MPGYMWFILSFLALIVGYLIYGKVVEKVFGADSSLKTPAYTHTDGVDYVSMPKWRLFLIQLLNIAGVGPVFGPILGALYGPTALLWVSLVISSLVPSMTTYQVRCQYVIMVLIFLKSSDLP